jgi:L-aspartate oxidase
MEFFQFHPTVLYLAGAPRLLISETARGEGGILRDREGRRFMPEYDPAAELAPRDVVSRSIVKQMARTGGTHVDLDMTHLDAAFLRSRFPKIHEVCSRYGIDITRDFIPVRPAAHYMIGGVVADENGRTSLPGLFACGEVASSWLHGANRLGSNSLLEGLVFGWRSGLAAAKEADEAGRADWSPGSSRSRRAFGGRMDYGIDVWDLRNSLRALMWRNVGIERDDAPLHEASAQMEIWTRLVAGARLEWPSAWELANMLTLSRLITAGALERTESRGVHYRKDFPDRNDARWKRSIVFERDSIED